MNEYELFVVNLILDRLQFDQAIINIYGGFFGNLLNGAFDKIGESKYQHVAEVVLHGDQRKIVRFLLEQGYIETVNHSVPSYKLVRKGFDAKKCG